MQRDVQISLLGPLRVTVEGHDVTPATVRDRRVLAALAIERAVSVDALVGKLWPDQEPPRSAHNSVQVTVSRIRILLGVGSVLLRGDMYYLAPWVITDLSDFERLRHSDELADLRALVEITSQKCLDDLRGDPDIDVFARMVQRHHRRAALAVGRHYLESGSPALALDVLEPLSVGDDDDAALGLVERAWQALRASEEIS